MKFYDRKKILAFFSAGWRYIAVLLIFVLVILFGRDLKISDDQATIENYKSILNRLQNGEYQISLSNQELEIPDCISTRTGDYYRIFLGTKAIAHDSEIHPSETFDPSGRESVEIQIFAKSDMGQLVELGRISAPLSGDYLRREVVFRANGNYSKLVFRRMDESRPSIISISNIKINRILCDTDNCIKKLSPTIIGSAELPSLDQFMTADRKLIYKFTSSGQSAGQIFQAKSDDVVRANLSLEKYGSGGLGTYRVELRAAKQVGDNFEIAKDILARYYFEPGEIDNNLLYDNVFSFPLAAKLTKDSFYYLGVSSEEVKVNYFNTIGLLGSPDSSRYSAGDALAANKPSRPLGDLFFQTFYGTKTLANGREIPYNASFEDLGDGNELFSYEYSNSSYDFLDIQQIDGDASGAYLDNIAGGVSFANKSGNSLIYKFDTIYPYKRLNFAITEIDGFDHCLIYYSYDGTNWIQVEAGSGTNNDVFSQTLDGGQQRQTIFIKVSSDPATLENSIGLFGIKRLSVHAEL